VAHPWRLQPTPEQRNDAKTVSTSIFGQGRPVLRLRAEALQRIGVCLPLADFC